MGGSFSLSTVSGLAVAATRFAFAGFFNDVTGLGFSVWALSAVSLLETTSNLPPGMALFGLRIGLTGLFVMERPPSFRLAARLLMDPESIDRLDGTFNEVFATW